MGFTVPGMVPGGQSVTGYVPTYRADATDEDLERKASAPEEQPTPEAAEPNLGFMGEDGKPVVYKAPEENTGRIEGKELKVPAAALHDEVRGRLTEHSGLASHADMQMAADVAMWARGTYGEKQRQLDEDFLVDMNDPDITGDDARLMERCNRFVTDRISDVHRNGNVLNGMHPFEDAHTYAERIMNYIRGGWEAIETDEWKAVRTMAAAEDYEGLKKFYNIDENKVVEDDDSPMVVNVTGPTAIMPSPQKQKRIVKKTEQEIREEIGEKVNGSLSRNFLWVYERMKPDLSDEGAAIVDHVIQRGSFDMNDAPAFKRLCRENRDEASKVKFLVDAARPTEEALWVDTGYETWKQLRDMVVKAGVGIGENMRRYLGMVSRNIESQLDVQRYERLIAEGVPADEAKRQIDEMRSEREIADMASERDRLAIRRAELDLDDMTYHKSWDGYGWFGRSVKGIFTTLPYMGVNAVPVAGFAMNTFSHMQEMEDRINQEGGDPTNGRMLRAFGAVAWAAVEKLEFDGMFGRTLTNMEKRNLWKHFLRDGIDRMAVNGWELGKAYGKEWAVKTGYETFQEGVQGGIESVEHDIGFFNHLDPQKRLDAHKMLRNAVGQFFEDMKESVGTMAGLSVGGAGVGTLRNVRRQQRAALDRESIDEILRRRNSVEAMVDGTWINADVSGAKAEHQRKVLDRLTSLWTEAKDRFEAMDRIRAEFGFNDEQVRKVADWLDIEQTALEGIAKEFGTEGVGEAVARLAGVRHDFVVGNDTVFDPKRLYAAFNANIKVEDVEVEDEERKGEAPQRPKRTIRRVTIPMVKPDGTTAERHIVINETTGAITEGMVKERGFATSLARACRKAGVDLMGIRITDDESERAASDAYHRAASQNPTAALDVATKVPGVTFFDKGNFHIVDEDTGKRLADANGIINLAVRAEAATDRSGNLSLTHETTHGIVKFAEELGVFGDTKSPDYDPAKNDMVMLFRQLFGNPMQEGELFNEEGLSDALAEFLRDEYDFGKFQSVDQRRMAERAFDGVAGLLKYAYNQVFHKELVTPRDVNQRREAQLAVFQAIRQGDFRGLSKYAGITFRADNRAKTDAKAAERTKEQAQESAKAPAKAAWRLRKRQGVQGDGQPTDAPTGVPGASDEVERLRADNERLMRELNAALAGGGVTVPARDVGGVHEVKSPISDLKMKVQWEWIPRKDVVPAKAGSSIQERFRMLDEASKDRLRRRAAKGRFMPDRFTYNPIGDRGAPILAGGNVCLSGNGRMMLLSLVAERGGYGEYLDAVRAWCRENGVMDCPADMLDKEPVLVQRIVEAPSQEAVERFARECNRDDKEPLGSAATAKAGVKAITPAIMRLYDVPPSGDFMSKSNWAFIEKFYEALGETVPKDELSKAILPEAGLRVQRAFLAKILGGDASDNEEYQKAVFLLISSLLSGGNSTATVRDALTRNGAELFAMLGNKGSYNVIPELRAAVETYVGWRAAVQHNPSLSLKDYVNTPDFFRKTSPIQDALAQLIEKRYFNALLKKYNELVAKQDVDAQGMLAIAGGERLTSGQLLAMAEREVVEKDADGNPVTPYVTPDPKSFRHSVVARHAAPSADGLLSGRFSLAPRSDGRVASSGDGRAALGQSRHAALMGRDPDYRAVYERFHGPDGSALPNWLKAPNGKPSNLDPVQFVQVRTPRFKAWFGDWENEAARQFLETETVASANGDEYAGLGRKEITNAVFENWKRVGGHVENPQIGDILLSKSGIHDSLAHGMGRAKIAAFNLVPEILSQGRVVRFRPNWEGRGYDSHVIAAPVTIGGKRHVALAIVNSNKGGNRFYLHEVGLLDEIRKNAEALRTGSSGETPALSRNLGDVGSIALSLFADKGASKVVDENGEPLVVYHGTQSDFWTFKKGERTPHGEIFFAPPARRNSVAGYYARDTGRIMPCFLNIKRPYERHPNGSYDINPSEYDGVVTTSEDEWSFQYYDYDAGKVGTATIKPGDVIDYRVFSPTQIKSATDNTGAFDPENPDIRYSIRVSPDEYAKLSSRVTENDARAYKAGVEPPPYGVAHTYDWGYAYDRFSDGTFAVTSKWNLNGKDGILFWQRQKEFYDELDKAAEAYRGDHEAFRRGRGHDGNVDVWLGDRAAAVGNAGLDGRLLRRDGGVPEGGADQQGALSDQGEISDTTRWSIASPALQRKLNEEKTITVYRSMQIGPDGKLYPPMAAIVDGKRVSPIEFGKWFVADEPTDIDEMIARGQMRWHDGALQFYLEKGDASGTDVWAAFNPYWHTSNRMLNDQFSSAYRRNLVTVECEVPVSEDGGTYRATNAKNATGWTGWHSGQVASWLAAANPAKRRDVFLSRYCKVTRIVPNAEVADAIAADLKGTDIQIPSNVIPTALRTELEKRGVPIYETVDASGKFDTSSYTAMKKAAMARLAQGVRGGAPSVPPRHPRYSVAKSLADRLDEERENLEKKGGRLILAAYHGTDTRGFTEFSKSDDIGYFFAKNRQTAQSYIREGREDELDANALVDYDEAMSYLRDEASGPMVEHVWAIKNEYGSFGLFPVRGQDFFETKEDAEDYMKMLPSLTKGRSVVEADLLDNYRLYEGRVPYKVAVDAYLEGTQDKAGVYTVALRMEKPYEIDAEGANWDSIYDYPETQDTTVYEFVGAYHLDDDDGFHLKYRIKGDEERTVVDYDTYEELIDGVRKEMGDEMADIFLRAYTEKYWEDFTACDKSDGPNGSIYTFDSFTGRGEFQYPKKTRDIVSEAADMGCDGVIIHNVVDNGGGLVEGEEDDVYVVMKPNQIKAADDVTYADDGSIIPDEQRLNWSNDDIRFSLGHHTQNAVRDFADGRDSFIENPYGRIVYAFGNPGHITENGRVKGGHGLMHIVYSRMVKDGASLDEAVDTAIRVGDAIETGEETETRDNKKYFRKDGIEGIFARNYDGQLVLTGYKIIADGNGGDKLVPPTLRTTPPPRKEDVVAAMNRWLENQPTQHSIPYPADGRKGVRFSIAPVYTGSAADYDKPSLLHVGSGEGSQVYGWGLYGSGVRGVAEGYAKIGSEEDLHIVHKDGSELGNDWNDILFTPRHRAEQMLEELRGYSIIREEKSMIDMAIDDLESRDHEDAAKWLDEHRGEYRLSAQKKPHVYSQTFFTNRAPGDESHLLLWYEPVSEENLKRISDAIAKTGRKIDDGVLLNKAGTAVGPMKLGMTGQGVYQVLTKAFNYSEEAASEFLARADIDGIKYPVDSYGGKGVKNGDEAGWNYVSFRDDNIRIDHKWVDGQKRFSIASEVHAVMAKNEKGKYLVSGGKAIHFAKSIPILSFLGVEVDDVFTIADRVRKIINKHGLTEDQVSRLFDRDTHPVAVYLDVDGKGSIVILTDMIANDEDGKRKPVMVFLSRAKGSRSEFIASAYCRNDRGESAYVAWKSKLAYLDENKIANLGLKGETDSQLQPSTVGDDVRTFEDFSSWSTPHSIPQSPALAQGGGRLSLATPGAALYFDESKVAALGLEEGTTSTLCTLTSRDDVMTPEGYPSRATADSISQSAPRMQPQNVVERDFDEDAFNETFGGGESRRRVGVRIGKPIDVVTGYAAAQILGGREVKVKDVDAILKNVGVRDASAPDVLASAQGIADRLRESAKTRVEQADPSLYMAFANESLLERVKKQIHESIVTGAAVADPEIGARLQRAVQAQARRAMDAAKGFTARQMQQELPISLADGVFAEAEYERSPEEKAKLEEMRKKREEEAEAEKQAAADAGLSLEEYREQLQADRDANTVYVEPNPEQKRYFEELMDRAKAAKEKEAEEEAEKKAKRQSKKSASADGGSADADPEPSGEVGEGAGPILPIETVKRIAPIFGDADTFAMFIAEWCADNVVKRHPEIPNTAQMWRNPVAVRELIKTAQNILEDLAMDVLGSPAINAARNHADRSIILLAERKTYRGVVHHIAYTYDMIHNQALRLSRRKLVGDLIKAGDKATGAKGRFSATQEMKTRTTFAKTELWWRHLRPFLTMSEEKLTEEISRLQGIVDGYNMESEEGGYDADNFQEYRDACDKLALANRYGGMVRWRPSRIQEAAAEIMMDLNGRRAEFEAMRDERDADNKRLREAIIKAVEAGGTERYRKEAGKLVRHLSRYGESLNGNLTLEMQNLIRYCKDEAARAAALEAIDELAIMIGRASEKYRVTLGNANAEVNAALADIYGSAEAGLRHLMEEKIPEDVALQIFSQSRNYIPTYGQLLQLYASCLQKDYKDNVEKHDRSDQIELMRSALTDQDLALHAWAIEWYAHNRQELSDAVEEITGLSVASPDNLYCPVSVLQEKSGFTVEALAWTPVPTALNRRVKHGLDFNESANFLSMLCQQCEIRAQLIGYGVAGIRLRDIIVHHDTQAAVRQHVGKGDMKVVSDHVRDVLVQGIEAKSSEEFFRPLNVARKWLARFYLSGNIPSAWKQLASRPVWANVVGFKGAMRYYASAFTPEGWARTRELIGTDGFKARYMMGWSEETQNIIRNPSKNRVLAFIGKMYDYAMWVNKGVDMLSCLWMAQGFYGDAKQAMLDKGFAEDEARERAAALTWSVCENGQQSGRIENMNRIQRKHQESAGAIFQFMTAYLLQNAYEIQAMRECAAGTPGAKGRLVRALVINHVLIPAYVELVMIAWRAVMGDEPLPDEPDKWPEYVKDLVWSCLFGAAAPLYMYSQMGKSMYDRLTGKKKRWRSSGAIPAEGILKVGENVGTLVYDAGKFGLQELTPLDFEEEVTVEALQDEFLRAADSVLAPARHLHKGIKNRTE